jgi:hypothetical protein
LRIENTGAMAGVEPRVRDYDGLEDGADQEVAQGVMAQGVITGYLRKINSVELP